MQGGCIIRAVFLDDIYQAYKRNPALENLMMDEEFGSKLVNSEKAWRSVVIKVLRLMLLQHPARISLQVRPNFILQHATCIRRFSLHSVNAQHK